MRVGQRRLVLASGYEERKGRRFPAPHLIESRL
jgi:hypothetical protein